MANHSKNRDFKRIKQPSLTTLKKLYKGETFERANNARNKPKGS